LTWVGPLSAAAIGLLGSGTLDYSALTFLRAALALLLLDPILSAWRALWVQTDWRAPLQVGQVQPGAVGLLLPYAQSDSPIARVAQWWNERAAFFTQALWHTLGGTLTSLLVLMLIAIAVAMVLGPVVVALTLLTLFLAPLETELGPRRGAWARALAELGIAWVVGFAALALPDARSVALLANDLTDAWGSPDFSLALASSFAQPAVRVFILALLFSFAYRGLLAVHTQARHRFVWSNLAQIGAALVMVAAMRPAAAGVIALVVIAQILWQAFARDNEHGVSDYLPRVQWFFLLAMLAASIFPI
jgi:hypothetical protein